MNRIVRFFLNGKYSWDCSELAADPSILPAIWDAHTKGLILAPKVGKPSKSLEARGVPIMAVVVGLTAAGQAMADRFRQGKT